MQRFFAIVHALSAVFGDVFACATKGFGSGYDKRVRKDNKEALNRA